ncbi:MAG: aminopeptidase P family protein [Treponema sp.]|nr:aminopeptidase P family protein [Treponema sp.]
MPDNTGLIESLQKAVRGEGLDGWLFCNFRHRDRLADEILGIPDSTNSRYWFYAVAANGQPLKIIHSVEPDALDTLPGEKIFYVSRDDLLEALKPLTGKSWGVHSSEELAAISYLDAGMAAVLKNAGLRLVSAAPLIQRVKSLLDAEGIKSHERAAVHLYEIVRIAWALVQKHYREQKPLWEKDVQSLMLGEMEARQLVTEHDLIVAAGINSGNPHYSIAGRGALIKEGDIVQFDLWAKEKQKTAVFADISWAGVYAQKAPDEAEKCFAALVKTREGALSFITEELSAGHKLTGAAVDQKAREIVIGCGFQKGLKHRTGHGIDTEIHGSGVNIDSVEFPDSRQILEGSCFSLEPGLYFAGFGMRTEIDVYIANGSACVSGKPHERQQSLLNCG